MNNVKILKKNYFLFNIIKTVVCGKHKQIVNTGHEFSAQKLQKCCKYPEIQKKIVAVDKTKNTIFLCQCNAVAINLLCKSICM